MTILFITHYSGFYGANKSLLKLIVLLRDRHGVSPIVLLPSQGQMCDELEASGIPYRVMHYYWWVNYNHGLFQYFLNKRKQIKNLFKVGKLCAFFKDFQIDLVYSNSVTINIGVFISKRLGIPHIWQLRESMSQYNLSLSLSRYISRVIWNNKCTKRFVLISDFMMDYYGQYLPKERMVRIYNGVNYEGQMSEIQKKKNSSRINLCSVGVICDKKNQIDAVKAVALLRAKDYDVCLHLVGTSQEDYLNLLKKTASDLGVEENVVFHGHQGDIFATLSSMDIGLATSIDEAFGRTTIEYMLCGMPVIASNSGANPELVKDGVNGYIYSTGDAHDLADKIERFIKEPSLIESMGKQAKEYAESNFTAENNADQIYKVITDVLYK